MSVGESNNDRFSLGATTKKRLQGIVIRIGILRLECKNANLPGEDVFGWI